jgi:23S rRNA pseudoU1915 N3-methylase RlmH
MRLLLICLGRPKAGPERDLAARYIERAAAGRATGISGVELREAEESRAVCPDDRKREEAEAIRPRKRDCPRRKRRADDSSRLIRELAGVLPRRRHFPLLDGVMG